MNGLFIIYPYSVHGQTQSNSTFIRFFFFFFFSYTYTSLYLKNFFHDFTAG